MPATVDNNTLLKAFNQTIQALLDLATSISSNSNGCPDVTVNVPASEPVINVYNTVKCGGCGSGGSGSVGSGSPVDSDPTDGYTPGNDPVIDAAKCKRVNYVIDKYIDFLGLWGAVEGLLAIGPAEALAAYLLGSGSLVFSSILVAGALITLFWSVVTLFTGGLVIFSYIVAHAVDVRANREELTCAMYNAATPGDMRQAIIDFMSNHLAGLPQAFVTYHVDAIFSNNVLNGIFNGWTDTGVIAELNAYTAPVSCGGCGNQPYLLQLTGTAQPTGQQQAVGDWRTVYSTVEDGYHLIALKATGGCVLVEFRNLSGWEQGSWYRHFEIGNITNGDVHESNSFSAFASAASGHCGCDITNDFMQWGIISATAFTVEIKVSKCS